MDIWATILTELGERADGPLSMRLILQPSVACILAIRDGLRDARQGHPPYFWSIVTSPAHRAELMRDGWKSIGKVFVLVIALDLLYLYLVSHAFLPRQSVILAFLLAVIPYLVLRGATTRIASAVRRRG
jgi:hypothetical protein